MASNDKLVVHLSAGLWTVNPAQFVKYIKDYISEFKNFDPDNFLIVNHFLLKGDRTYAHKEDLCEVVDIRGWCGKCRFNKTVDCPRGIQAHEDKTTATRLLEITEHVTLFKDKNTAYAWMKLGDARGWEAVPISSEDFKRYLSYEFYKEEKKPPSAEAITSSVDVLSAKAAFEGDNYELHNRVAWHDNALYYDLCSRGQAVRIDESGWQILDRTPVPMFKKYDHQKPAFLPLHCDERSPAELRATMEELLDFLNHDKNDRMIRVLILVTVLSYFIEGFAHPVAVIHGEHGNAKTCFGVFLKMLIDNSDLLNQGLPKGSDNIVQAVEQHWFSFFDNLSEIYDWQSDIFCRTVTKTGQQTRKLYTDDGVVIRVFRRCIALNGITNVVERPDLLDRSILIPLPRIPESERIQEKLLEESFREAGPRIIGTVFDILSHAMSIYPTIKTKGLYRLADWTQWGCAICRAMGIDENDFLKAYANNRDIQREEAISSDDVATSVVSLMQDRLEPWTGAMTDLWDELCNIAQKLRISTTSRDWPSKPNKLAQRMPRITKTLSEIGITIEYTGRDKWSRRKLWTITKGDVISSVTSDTEDGAGLMHYLENNGAPNDGSMPIDNPRVPQNEGSRLPNDSNDRNDSFTEPREDILKDEEQVLEPVTVSRAVAEYEGRWLTFLERTSHFDTKHIITLEELDTLYADNERGRMQKDLDDWTREGRLWINQSKKRRGWRVSERGSPTED